MAPRAGSPVSESLLWKGRLLRDYKTLLNSNISLKSQLTLLSARVVAAEETAKAVKTLGDRLAAIEEDDGKVREVFERLDGDRGRRIRELELKEVGMTGKIERLARKAEEATGAVEDLRQARGEVVAVMEERQGKMKADVERLREQLGGFQKELRAAYESTIVKTGGLQLGLTELEKKVKTLAERPGVAAEHTTRRGGRVFPQAAHAPEQASEPPTRSTVQPVPKSQPVASKGRKAAAPKKALLRKAPARRQPAKQVSTGPPQAPIAPPQTPIAAVQASVSSNAPRRGPRLNPTAVPCRTRSTRFGSRGTELTSQADYNPRLRLFIDEPEVPDKPKQTSTRSRIKRQLGDVNEKSDASSSTAAGSPVPPAKRAKQEQTTEARRSARNEGVHSRMFPNLNLSVVAESTTGGLHVKPATPMTKSTPGPATISTPAATMASTKLEAADATTSGYAGNHPAALTAPLQQVNARPSSSTSSKRVKKRAVRMPNLPPTPPRPSRVDWDLLLSP